MLHLHFAPSLDLLVPTLLAKLREVWTDPFLPPAVIVPSPAVGKWLRMRLADTGGLESGPVPLGCTANLAMQTLERYLLDALRPAPDMALLDVGRLRQVICALLDESLLGLDVHRPLREYLLNPSQEIDPLKRVQLSARIAHQFLEYEYNRPSVWDPKNRRWLHDGIDASWLLGKRYFGANAEHEDWQKDLYCRATRCLDSTLDSSAMARTRYVTLPRLYRLRREKGLDDNAPWTVPGGPVFLFGVSKVSHFHRNVLVEISQAPGVDIRVFLTNPCAEFWETVDTRRNRAAPIRRGWRHDSKPADAGIAPRNPADYAKETLGDFADLPRDHALLELWGASGKENIFLWCPRAAWDFEYYSPGLAEFDPGPATLLQAVQVSLLRGQHELPQRPEGWAKDGSLTVLACPDRGREIEELREQILDLVHEGEIDRLNEIAVYLPDPGPYMPHIQRVFGARRPGSDDYIPFTILGGPGSDSVFGQGLRTLLELIGGQFDKPHVFAFLRNPIVQATREITTDDVAVWERWAGDLGIFRGFNRAHRGQMGDSGQTVTDVHTFELGMARMLIGNLAAGPIALDCVLPGGGENGPARTPIPPFRDFDTSDHDRLEKFCAVMEELHCDIQEIRGGQQELGIPAAVEQLTNLAWKWFGRLAEDRAFNSAAEARVRREFLDALQSILLQASLANRPAVAIREFLMLAESCLPSELPAGSAAWTGGVTFAPLRPAMIVPHRVIFAAGLDAAAFPGTADRPAWNLLTRKRIVGDSDVVRDNRFAFLELLHAARERLVLSFRANDMQKEEELQPASVVLELEAYLQGQAGIAAPESGVERGAIRRTVPWIVHESLDSFRKAGRRHGTWSQAEIELARLAGGTCRLTHRHDLAHRKAPAAAPGTGPALFQTNLFHIRKFFSNPIEYHLSKTLGIELDESQASAQTADEPLASTALVLSSLQKEIWKALLARLFPAGGQTGVPDEEMLANEAQAIAQSLYGELVAAGQSPEAQFCRMEERKLLQWARQCAAATRALGKEFPKHALMENTDLSLGREGIAADLMIPLSGAANCVVECRHPLVLVPREGGGAVGIIGFEKEGDAADNPGLWLAGALQWMTERQCATGWEIRLVQLNRGHEGKKKTGYDCSTLREPSGEGKDIGLWLGGLLQRMLAEKCCDHLPFAVIEKLTRQNKEGSLSWPQRWARVTAAAIEEELSSDYGYTCWLESFHLADVRIPPVCDRELRQSAKDRFAPMLERWFHE